MRIILFLIVIMTASIHLAHAQPAEVLSGSYTGEIAGTPSTLTLERSGGTFNGAIDAGGYGYSLRGTAVGDSGSGMLTDHQAGAQIEFEIVERAGAVTVTLLAADPASGQVQRIPFEFRRGGDGPTAGGEPAQIAEAQGGGQNANIERDPALVGVWAYSDTYISGDFSATTRLYMQVNPDGSYLYGSGNVSAGLDNSLGSVYGQSGDGDVTRGQWRTESGIVYIMEAGSPQWVPYARYYVEGNSMMFTFGDGKRQLWSRR